VKFNAPRNGQKIDVAVDSTGLKLVNDGEYRTKKYKKVKSWAKFHTGINEKSGEAVNIIITKDNVGDCREFGNILDPVSDITNKVDCDKSYDTEDDFEYCKRHDMEPGIPVKLNASPKGEGPRRKAVREQFGIKLHRGRPPKKRHFMTTEEKEAKQKRWKKRIGHGYRWTAEGFYSRFKRGFGECIFSKKRKNIEKEVVMKTNILNTFITI
jgi:IS5 family transposase